MSQETKGLRRCFGDGEGKEFYAHYHDHEWGVPIRDDRLLFEMLCLEGAQAGLSWETILKKRSAYQGAFHQFNPTRVALMRDEELEALLEEKKPSLGTRQGVKREDETIVRHRGKIFSVRNNALSFRAIAKEKGSFAHYLWEYVDHQPLVSYHKHWSEVPAESEVSRAISRDLIKRGMKFVGPKIIYAYMQAVGLIDDHLVDCFRKKIA